VLPVGGVGIGGGGGRSEAPGEESMRGRLWPLFRRGGRVVDNCGGGRYSYGIGGGGMPARTAGGGGGAGGGDDVKFMREVVRGGGGVSHGR
jgi:hypothetical protein